MKKKLTLFLLCCFVLLLTSCEIILQPASTPVTQTEIINEPTITKVPLNTPIITDGPTQAPTDTPVPDPTPYNTMEFYSCHANMVSFDPATGWAEFDYFYMLTGQEAIDYLVEHEGYTQADAENLVNDFSDGEFVCQNNNPGLRTIDLNNVPIKLMYHPDGTVVEDAQGVTSTVADVAAVYNIDPDYLFKHYFFYIHCDKDGNVILVEQLYWC